MTITTAATVVVENNIVYICTVSECDCCVDCYQENSGWRRRRRMCLSEELCPRLCEFAVVIGTRIDYGK